MRGTLVSGSVHAFICVSITVGFSSFLPAATIQRFERIADTSMVPPLGSVPYAWFGVPSLDGDNIAFAATGDPSEIYGQLLLGPETGVYAKYGAGPLGVVANANTYVPVTSTDTLGPNGQTDFSGAFTRPIAAFGTDVSIDGTNVAFHARTREYGENFRLYYHQHGQFVRSPNSFSTIVRDTQLLPPVTTQRPDAPFFTYVSNRPSISGGHAVFHGGWDVSLGPYSLPFIDGIFVDGRRIVDDQTTVPGLPYRPNGFGGQFIPDFGLIGTNIVYDPVGEGGNPYDRFGIAFGYPEADVGGNEDPQIDAQGNVVFFGRFVDRPAIGAVGPVRTGLYMTQVGGPLSVVADDGTLAPPIGGVGSIFGAFLNYGISNGNVAFVARTFDAIGGISTSNLYARLDGTLVGLVANVSPNSPIAIDNRMIAYHTDEGIEVWDDGVRRSYLRVGDFLDGREVRSVRLGPESLSNGKLAVRVDFTDFTTGIYVLPTWRPGPRLTFLQSLPAGVNFGRVRLGSDAARREYEFTNDGDTDSSLEVQTTDRGVFTSFPHSEIALPVNATGVAEIRLARRGFGIESLPIRSNGGSHSVGVSGTGVGPDFFTSVPEPFPDANEFDHSFGEVTRDVASSFTFEIRNATEDGVEENPGLVDLTLLGWTLEGEDAELFQFRFIDAQPGTVLHPGDVRLVEVTFNAPNAAGDRRSTAILTIATDEFANLGEPGSVYDFFFSADVVPVGQFLANRRFDYGLEDWMIEGPGIAALTEFPLSSGNTAVELTAGSPVTLSQCFANPEADVDLTFQYAIASAEGTLEVFLASQRLKTLTGTANPETLLVDHLLIPQDQLSNAAEICLAFRYDGPTGSLAYLDEVSLSTVVPQGDMDHDGDVDRQDVALFAEQFGNSGAVSSASGDFDGDSAVTVFDLALLQSNFSQGVLSPSAGTVPEPCTSFFATCTGSIAVGVFAIRRRIRRQKCSPVRAPI